MSTLLAKLSTAKTVTFGPVLAVDGTPYTGALAYTDAKVFKNGTDGALDGSAAFTHKYQGVYALALTANDISAVGAAEVVLNKADYAAAPVKLNVLPAAVYDSLVGGTDNLQVDVTQFTGTDVTVSSNVAPNFATFFGTTSSVEADTLILKSDLPTNFTSMSISAGGKVAATLSAGDLGNGTIAAACFVNGALDGVWSVTSRTLTANTNLGLPASWPASWPANWNWSTYAGTDTAGTTELLTRIPDATAGAAGGLLIAGSNAATTFASVTITSGNLPADVKAYTVQPTVTGATLAASQHVIVDSGTVTTLSTWDKSGYSLSATGWNGAALPSMTTPLDAAGTRSALGMATANLDTQLGLLVPGSPVNVQFEDKAVTIR